MLEMKTRLGPVLLAVGCVLLALAPSPACAQAEGGFLAGVYETLKAKILGETPAVRDAQDAAARMEQERMMKGQQVPIRTREEELQRAKERVTRPTVEEPEENWLGTALRKYRELKEWIFGQSHEAVQRGEEKIEEYVARCKDGACRLEENIGDASESTKRKAEEAGESFEETAGRVKEDIKRRAHETGETIRAGIDDAKERAAHWGEYLGERAGDAKESVEDKAGDVKRTAESVKEAVKEKAHDSREAVKQTASNIKERAVDAAEAVREKTADIAGAIKEKAGGVKDAIKHKAEDVKEAVAEKAADLKEAVGEAKDYAARKMEDAKEYIEEKAIDAKDALKSTLVPEEDEEEAVTRPQQRAIETGSIEHHIEVL